MDLERAHAILGVDPDTPLAEVRASYLARAKLLHPDRLHGDRADVQGEAARAMADLNAAWDVIQAAGENRHLAEPVAMTSERPDADLRLAIRGECDLCGCAPAVDIELRQITGVVLFWRSHRYVAELCRPCATGMFRKAQAHNLVRGWWGIIAPLANMFALAGNAAANSRIKDLPQPRMRDPHVVTPLPGPLPPRPGVLSRPGPWFATIAAIAIAVIGLGSIVGQPSSSGGGSPRNLDDTVIGSCLDIDGYGVPCSDPSAAWKITGRGPNCGTAPAVFTDPETNRTYCAELN